MDPNKQVRKVRKIASEVSEYDFIICPNCGAEEVGKYCPNCGQSNKDYNKPLKEIFGDLLDSINLDIRLVNTIFPFFFKPGFLTQEYFKGKRRRYVPPMRLYILFSVLFFFLAQFANMDKIKGIGKASSEAVLDSTRQDSTGNYVLSDSALLDRTLAGVSEEELDEIRNDLMEDTSIDAATKEFVVGGIDVTKNIDAVYGKFLKNISYILFVLMPFFALILAATLWRSRKLYVHHLIFSINFHSFVFGAASLIIILNRISPERIDGYYAYLIWAIPLYLMFGIRRYYTKTYVKAFFKTFGIGFLYSLVIFIVLIGLAAFTARDFYQG